MLSNGPDLHEIRALADRVLRCSGESSVERVADGVSTYVYRVGYGGETFYLRILPEEGASFAPEVKVLALLHQQGVRVPRVLYFDDCDALLQRSVMLTTEIAGQHVGHRTADEATRHVLGDAGRDLAIINAVPVAGFGWIKRDRGIAALTAKHSTWREAVFEYLDADLAMLEGRVLTHADTATIRAIVESHGPWITAEEACLAHGDFDVTQIFQHGGQYSGVIDFGEIRGAEPWYDLGHFRMHDGETLPVPVLDWLLEGYSSVTRLPADCHLRIAFASLLIAVRTLTRCLEWRPEKLAGHRGLTSIQCDLVLLRS